jgi:spore germination protein Q
MSCFQGFQGYYRGTTAPQYMHPQYQQPKPQMQGLGGLSTPGGSYIPGTPVGPGMTGTPGMPGTPGIPGMPALPTEESYIENILRLNLGKTGTFYLTYENNKEWNAKIFKGRIEAAGRDHIIISDPTTGMRYLLLMVNLDYVTFDEPLNYSYPIR